MILISWLWCSHGNFHLPTIHTAEWVLSERCWGIFSVCIFFSSTNTPPPLFHKTLILSMTKVHFFTKALLPLKCGYSFNLGVDLHRDGIFTCRVSNVFEPLLQMLARMLVGIYFTKKLLIFFFIAFPGGLTLSFKFCGGGECSEGIVVCQVTRMGFLWLLLLTQISLALKLNWRLCFAFPFFSSSPSFTFFCNAFIPSILSPDLSIIQALNCSSEAPWTSADLGYRPREANR